MANQYNFNEAIFYLGFLCEKNHNYKNSEKSLRYKNDHRCVQCKSLNAKRYLKNHSEERKNYSKKYREKNKEKIRLEKQEYNEKHKDEIKTYSKNWRENNQERIKETSRVYYQKNRNKIRVAVKDWYENNKEKANQTKYLWEQKQKELKTNYFIASKLRTRVNHAFNQYSKTGKIKSSDEYGIDYQAIIEHLGLHPNNLGIPGKWHIDHIVPLSKFDLNDFEQIKLAFAPENHRWLRAKENLEKGNNVPIQTNLFLMKQQEIVQDYQ